MGSIPFFIQPLKFPRITEQQFRDGMSGVYRYDPDKFTEVVRSCPDVPLEIADWIIRQVTEYAAGPDGSIDVMKAGIVMGRLMNTMANSYTILVSNWINNLDRLPMYKQGEEDEAQVRDE